MVRVLLFFGRDRDLGKPSVCVHVGTGDMVQYADRVHVHMSVLYNVSCVMNYTQNRIARIATPERVSGRIAHSRFDYQTHHPCARMAQPINHAS